MLPSQRQRMAQALNVSSNLEEDTCQRKLRNITRRHQNIILMPLGITVKQPSITKADITRRRHITLTRQGRTRSMQGTTLKKQQRPMAKNTAKIRTYLKIA